MTPIIILDASTQPYLSIGVRFGGIIFQGKDYVYIPETDAYVRKDYIKKLKAMKWPKFVEYVKTVEQ